jgi:hypothetical protein
MTGVMASGGQDLSQAGQGTTGGWNIVPVAEAPIEVGPPPEGAFGWMPNDQEWILDVSYAPVGPPPPGVTGWVVNVGWALEEDLIGGGSVPGAVGMPPRGTSGTGQGGKGSGSSSSRRGEKKKKKKEINGSNRTVHI